MKWLAFALLAAGCISPGVVDTVPDQSPVTTRCEEGCANLHGLDCEPPGCAELCSNLEADGQPVAQCLLTAETCEQAEEC